MPERAVVFSDDDTSYQIAAFAPVYVANALPGHVADTKANRPYARRDDAKQFFRTGDLAIPRRYGATWLVIKTAALEADARPAEGVRRTGTTFSTVCRREGAARLALLPARRRRRRPAHAEDRDAPARARDRDARARAGRPEVGAPRRRARAADAGVGASRALRRPARPPARAGAARQDGPRPHDDPGAALRPPAARPGRERPLEPDRDPGGDPASPAAKASTSC